MMVAVYILALGAYCFVGFGLFSFGMLMTMDTGLTKGALLYYIIVASLWVTGLVLGTQAYY